MKTRKFKPNPITWYGSVDVFSVCARTGRVLPKSGGLEINILPKFYLRFFQESTPQNEMRLQVGRSTRSPPYCPGIDACLS